MLQSMNDSTAKRPGSGDIAPGSGGSSPVSTGFFGHPPGLMLLFIVEMWERFSYYGMRAILVLYLTSPTTGMRKRPEGAPEGFNPGPGWSDADANTLLGWYAGLVYLTPILGGLIADQLIGTHRSMVVGGVLIMLGHLALGLSGLVPDSASIAAMAPFVGGLALIVIGTGHFKPCVSVMVGQLYPAGHPRRDGAFSIFYMGINVGALIGGLICGLLGEQVGWHWGFGAAAVGMALGLIIYVAFRPRYLRGIGEIGAGTRLDGARDSVDKAGSTALAPDPVRRRANLVSWMLLAAGLLAASACAWLFASGALTSLLSLVSVWVIGGVAVAVLGLAVWFIAVQRREDRGPVTSIFIFMAFNVFFWLAFEQAASSMTLYTDRYTDTQIGSWLMPTSWFQSVNPAFIILFAPLFAAAWTALGQRGRNPSQPVKIGMGLILLGLGFGVLVLGARTIVVQGQGDEQVVLQKAAVWYLLAAYFLHTMGELCLSPTGLSYVTKAAPVRFVSLLMGVWFISSFVANLTAGLLAAQLEPLEKGERSLPWSLGEGTGTVQADFFFLFVLTSVGAGVLILLLTPWLKRLMRRTDD
jgi:POT family proton-dependent oligopeptide transporter